MREDFLATESINEGGTACNDNGQSRKFKASELSGSQLTSSRGAADHQTELNSLLHILLPANLDL